jgi:hypothetical protein
VVHSLADRLSTTDSKRVSNSIARFLGVEREVQVDIVILNLYPVGDTICSMVYTMRSLHMVAKVGAKTKHILELKTVNEGSGANEIYEMNLLAM